MAQSHDQQEGMPDVTTTGNAAHSSTTSFHDWLCSKRLEELEDKLLKEGFECAEDFEGLHETDLRQLCDKMKINKIGLKTRFIKTINKLSVAPIIIMSTAEQENLANLQSASDHSQKLIDTFKLKLKELNEVKTQCENDVKNDFIKIRKAIDDRESKLYKEINNIYKQKFDKLNELINDIETKMNELDKTFKGCYNSLQPSNKVDANALKIQRQNLIETSENALNKYYQNGAKMLESTFDIENFIKMKYDNNDNNGNKFLDNINDYSMIIGDLTMDAPIIDKMQQTDSTTVRVSWKNTEKNEKYLEKCKDVKNVIKYELLPMIIVNDNNNNNNNNKNLIVLKSIELNNELLEYDIVLSDNFANDFKFDEKSNDNFGFECQMRTIHKSLNIQSQWSNVSKIDFDMTFNIEYNCTFTNLNGVGRTGPTTLGDYYKGQCHENDVILDENGMQIWTVPYSGYYNIIAYGASGGNNIHSSSVIYGGKGAKVGGSIELKKGNKLKILIGQQGLSENMNVTSGGGGGGGTFIVLMTNDNNNEYEALFIAAGGNGACYYSWQVNGIDGLGIECNNRNDNNDEYGGYVSNGRAARGASYKNDESTFKSHPSYNKCDAKSFDNGGLGGQKYQDSHGSDGGFGGGGGSRCEGGGGGGYIGALVARCNEYDKQFSNYGALSFNCCKNEKYKIMQSGANVGNGKIHVKFCGFRLN